MKRIHHVLFLAAVVLLWNHSAQATDISGAVASTVTITADSQLTGDVRCTVTLAPCIKFGASGIKLNLNGHIMTGNGSRSTCIFPFPPASSPEDGIFTNLQNAVSIEGPGIVRRFRSRGIEINGNDSVVKHVTVLSSCQEGIVVGGHHNLVEDNSVARASLATNLGPIFDASIWVQGSGGHYHPPQRDFRLRLAGSGDRGGTRNCHPGWTGNLRGSVRC